MMRDRMISWVVFICFVGLAGICIFVATMPIKDKQSYVISGIPEDYWLVEHKNPKGVVDGILISSKTEARIILIKRGGDSIWVIKFDSNGRKEFYLSQRDPSSIKSFSFAAVGKEVGKITTYQERDQTTAIILGVGIPLVLVGTIVLFFFVRPTRCFYLFGAKQEKKAEE